MKLRWSEPEGLLRSVDEDAPGIVVAIFDKGQLGFGIHETFQPHESCSAGSHVLDPDGVSAHLSIAEAVEAVADPKALAGLWRLAVGTTSELATAAFMEANMDALRELRVGLAEVSEAAMEKRF